MAADRQQCRVRPGREIRHGLDQRPRKEEHLLERYVFAERYQMHFPVRAARRPVGSDQKRRIVVLGRHAVLDLIAADENRHVRLAGDRTNPIGSCPLLLEIKGRGRLRPHHELGALSDSLARHVQIVLKDGSRSQGIPFLRLIDVALHEPDAYRVAGPRPFGARRATGAPDRNGDQHEKDRSRRDQTVRQLPGRHRQSRARADRRDERRDAIHTRKARQLRHRKCRRLTVTEEHPREASEQVRSAKLGRHPHGRGCQQPAQTVRDEETRLDDREDRRKQRQVGDERDVDQHRGHGVQAAVDDHDTRDPVKCACEIHGAGRQSQAERTRQRRRRRGWDSGAAVRCQRDKQRRQGDPAHRRMTKLRKAQRKKNARRGREGNIISTCRQAVFSLP